MSIATSSFDCGSFGSGFSLYGWGGCSPYGYPYSGYSRYGYSQYGYSPYGYTGGYGGWYEGSQPFVILLNPGNTTSTTHGQVVNGRGYVEGNSGDRGTATQSSAPVSSGSSAPASSGSSGSSGASSAGSSSSGGDGGRTAQPR